ncbi:hypothetical protein HDU91_007451 [Kappamyces sp. JEL0680]|nr:hypothetical protein HDU91_007451 [Kappamyces sp. JEL0680]
MEDAARGNVVEVSSQYFLLYFTRYFDKETVLVIRRFNPLPRTWTTYANSAMGDLLLEEPSKPTSGTVAISKKPTEKRLRPGILTKILVGPPIGVYLATRIAVHSLLACLHFSVVNLYGLLPFFSDIFRICFRWCVSQIGLIRAILQLFFTYVFLPIFQLATPFIELTIEVSVNATYKAYQLHKQYTPIVIARLREFTRHWSLVIFNFWSDSLSFLFTFVKDGYYSFVLPAYRQTREIAKTIWPILLKAFLDMVKILERLDERYRPVLMPYLQFVLFQFQILYLLSWRVFVFWAVSVWSVAKSPYTLARYFWTHTVAVLEPILEFGQSWLSWTTHRLAFYGRRWTRWGIKRAYRIWIRIRLFSYALSIRLVHYHQTTREYVRRVWEQHRVEERLDHLHRSLAAAVETARESFGALCSSVLAWLRQLGQTSADAGEAVVTAARLQMQAVRDFFRDVSSNTTAYQTST